MADKSNIEWTDATWPIVQGCDPLSPGCAGCYAVPLLWRLMHNPHPNVGPPLVGVVEKHVNRAGEEILRFTGKIALREDRLSWPLEWKKPRMIFVPSHGDLFHKDVPVEFIDRVFETMGACDDQGLGHQFQVLTKRSERQRDYVSSPRARKAWNSRRMAPNAWPPRNIWFGVSAERQKEADERIPHLLSTPAAVRFLSAEPLLGPIDLTAINRTQAEGFMRPIDGRFNRLDWVICGGESGPDAHPMHPAWARSLRDQCTAAGVAFFFKQWGAWQPHQPIPGGDLGGDCRTGRVRIVHPSGRTDEEVFRATGGRNTEKGSRYMERVGKKAAGRLLDGIEHNAMPGASKAEAA